MREDLLHFIWKNQKFSMDDLKTSAHDILRIEKSGVHNKYSGPDFLNARLDIGGQLWAGNVEIHCKSSDWFNHGHESDPAYDNVILHVVWDEDKAVCRKSGEPLPTLVLQDYVQKSLLGKYRRLLDNSRKRFINCEAFNPLLEPALFGQWRDQLYRERLNYKLRFLNGLFLSYKKDWERLLFTALLRNFGQGVNSDSFYSIARAIDYRVFIRLRSNKNHMECLLLGMAGLLETCDNPDPYFNAIRQDYIFLQGKYKLVQERIEKPEFMGVRPSGFPTIRLSQFAALYARSPKLFYRLMDIKELNDYYELFDLQASDYWCSHYTFGQRSKYSIKKVSKHFINNIIVNTIMPLKRLHALEYGKDNFLEIRTLLLQMKREDNSLLVRFKSLGFTALNAMDSQALIHMYNFYCKKNRCLECAIGSRILN